MAYAKAVVDFSKYAGGDIGDQANNVQDKMLVKNIASFTGAPYTAAAFLAVIETWGGALADSLKGGTDRTTTKNNARAALEEALFELGTFVNLKAKGDQATIDLSGFPSYTTDRTKSTGGVTFIPQNARWEDGTVSGQEILRWKGDGTRAAYEVQTCTGDPNLPGNWTYRGSFTGGKAVLDGFTPGTVIWGRVRKIGTGGEVGDWSDPAQIRAS
jgi:hypothetical protein